MADKKTFGSFIKTKRTEKITTLTDTDTRKMEHEARKFRVIRSIWFWVPTISYAVALLTCFICNLAVSHTLSWFFIVLTALICAYSFIPTFTLFFKSKKLLVFTVTSFSSICLLLYTCALYTGGLYWFPVACIGILMGYILVFGTILLSRTKLSHFKFVIAFTSVFALTILLLLCVHSWRPFILWAAILITIYAYIPPIFCAVICMFSFDGFFKASLCTVVTSCIYYGMGYGTNTLFGLDGNHYEVDFHNWEQCVTGNVHLIVVTAMLFISAVFFTIGFLRIRKGKK